MTNRQRKRLHKLRTKTSNWPTLAGEKVRYRTKPCKQGPNGRGKTDASFAAWKRDRKAEHERGRHLREYPDRYPTRSSPSPGAEPQSGATK